MLKTSIRNSLATQSGNEMTSSARGKDLPDLTGDSLMMNTQDWPSMCSSSTVSEGVTAREGASSNWSNAVRKPVQLKKVGQLEEE